MSGAEQMYPWQTDPKGFLARILGVSPNITSTFRSAAQNEAAGGSPTSEHLSGNAIDFTPPPGMNMDQLAQQAAQSGVPFDQLINEGNHVHIGFRPGADRGQTFAMHGGTPPPQVANQTLGGGGGDPVDSLFASAIASHSNASMPTASNDPVDALFASAISQHGTVPHPAPVQAPQPSMASDVLRSGMTGLAQGVGSLAGMGGDARDLNARIAKMLLGQNAGNAVNAIESNLPILGGPTTTQINSAIGNAVGGFHVPQTTAGQYAQTIGSYLPAAVGGEGSLARRLLARAIIPGAASETGGQLLSGTPYESAGRIAGGLAGGLPAIAGGGAKALAGNLTSALSPEDAALVASYENLGGKLRPGMYNPSGFVRQADSVLSDAPFQPAIRGGAPGAAGLSNENLGDAYNTALSRTFGENSPRLTGDVLANAQSRIGKTIDTVVSRNSITDDPTFKSDLAALQVRIANVAPALDRGDVRRLTATSNKIASEVANGLSGENYQSMRARGGLLQGLSDDSNSTVAGLGQKLRDVLDDAFERQAPAADATLLGTARQQYRALKTIEPVANAAPTGQVQGNAALLGRVISEYGNPNNAGDLGTIARVGKAYLKPQSNSGTSERGFWRALITNPVKAVGEVATVPATATIGRALNTAINSPDARKKALAAALQNGQVSRGLSAPSAALLAPFLLGR